MKKVLIIDNYDSFVYNLYQSVKELDPEAEIKVVRNDAFTCAEISAMKPDQIIVSPGPGRPEDAGITLELIKSISGAVPLLGVCLGHQAIARAFGGKVIHAGCIVHGRSSLIHHTEAGILREIPNPFEAARYHSLAVEERSLPECMVVTAKDEKGEIMGLQHKERPLFGVQFHPESILTSEGKKIMANFLAVRPGLKQTVPVVSAGTGISSFERCLKKLFDKQNLSFKETSDLMNEVMSGKAGEAQIAGFLTALRMKGETGEELAAMAKIMQTKALTVSGPENAVDTCGTGGDGAGTCNISTASAFIVSASGVPVAKHGNRSVSGKVGSADVLEAGGYRLQKTVQEMSRELSATAFAFLFAPLLHPAMKYVMPSRRQLKMRTAFNLLGPVTNPARVRFQIVGVFDFSYAFRLARALQAVGTKRSLVVNGGFTDELTTCAENKALMVTQQEIIPVDINIETLGLHKGEVKGLEGEEDPQKAFFVIEQILSGKANRTLLETVALNAGALLFLSGKADSIKKGVEQALELIFSGAGSKKLEQVLAFQKAKGGV